MHVLVYAVKRNGQLVVYLLKVDGAHVAHNLAYKRDDEADESGKDCTYGCEGNEGGNRSGKLESAYF